MKFGWKTEWNPIYFAYFHNTDVCYYYLLDVRVIERALKRRFKLPGSFYEKLHKTIRNFLVVNNSLGCCDGGDSPTPCTSI